MATARKDAVRVSFLRIAHPPRSTLFPYTTLFRSTLNFLPVWVALSLLRFRQRLKANQDRKSGSAGMPRPTSYAVFCLKKKSSRAHGRVRIAEVVLTSERVAERAQQEPQAAPGRPL